MGRVVGPWGVRGWIKVAPYGDRPEGLASQRAWWLQDGDGGWARRDVGEARVHSGTVVASLAGIETPEDAKRWKGRDVAVPREALPKAKRGEMYVADLVGMSVVTSSGAALGTVVAVEDFGAHPVMRVAAGEVAGGADRLVPFVEPIVRAVDLEAGRVEVDWEPEY
jgi:16S rRNA processing protein RimM